MKIKKNLNIEKKTNLKDLSKKNQGIDYQLKKRIHQISLLNIMNFIFSLLLASVMWVQVPQWEADWSKCAVDIPDSSCHWYVAAPDNTFGEGFDWEKAPWFDANGLHDVAQIEKESVLEKLQKN